MAGIVQSASTSWFGGGGTSEAVTINGVTAGNLLAICVAWGTNTSTISSVAGNSNTYASITSASASGKAMALYYVAVANSGNTTITVTWSGDPGFGGIVVHEVNGVDGGLDGANWVINPQAVPGTGSNALTSTALTPSVANCYRFGATFNNNAGGTLTAGTNYTLAGNPAGWFGAERLTAGSGIDSGTSSVACTFTTTDGFGDFYTAQVIFKPSAGGGTPLFRVPSLSGLGSGGKFFHNPLH